MPKLPKSIAALRTGRSHRAIELLPRLAVLVTYCQSDHHYELTRKIGRHDVTLVPHDVFPEWVHRHRGLRKFSTIFFDHAVQEHCGPLEFEQLEYWLERAKPYLTVGYPDDAV